MVGIAVIGIDLGMTKSCVAVWQNDHVEIIVDDQGKILMPSERLIGDDAKNHVAINPDNTIYSKLLHSLCSILYFYV